MVKSATLSTIGRAVTPGANSGLVNMGNGHAGKPVIGNPVAIQKVNDLKIETSHTLDENQLEINTDQQPHSAPGSRLGTGQPQTQTKRVISGSSEKTQTNTTPIDNNNPTDKPGPVPAADPSAKTDPAPGVNPMAHLLSLDAIKAARQHPSNGTVKIPQELADAAKLAGAKIKKNLYGQPIGIEYRVRGMGKLKMRIDKRGEITSSVTSLNPAANPREMTSIFLQELQKNIPQTDVNDITANLLGLEVNLTTGEMSFNGEPIANFPVPRQNVVSYTFDRQGNFNPNLEALKDPNSYTSRMMRAISSLHGGSGSALNNVSDSYNKMLIDKQQFQLSPFTIRSACAEIDVTYDALADYRSEIKGHLREPDVLLTTYSKHLQEAKDRGIQEDQLVKQAIDATIRQYQTLTGNNLGKTNRAYAKEFLTVLKLNEAKGYAVEDLEIEDINNAAISAGIAAAAIEINFADFSKQLDGEIPQINGQACPDIDKLNEYTNGLTDNLEKHRGGNTNPVIRGIVQGFNQQGIAQQNADKFENFIKNENNSYEKANLSLLTAAGHFRGACQAIVPQQDNQFAADLPQPAQDMLLKAAWLVDSNPAISKENAPYLIVGALRDKPEFQNVSLRDLTHLAEASIAFKDAMAGPNSPNSLLQKLDFKDPANCKEFVEKTGQPIVIKKFDDGGHCIGATLYQISEDEGDEIKSLELKYNNETYEFFDERDPNNSIHDLVVSRVALKFDLKADEIKVSTLNPAPAGGVPPPAGGVPPPAGGVPPPAGGVPPPAPAPGSEGEKEFNMFDGVDLDGLKDFIDDGSFFNVDSSTGKVPPPPADAGGSGVE